MADSKISALTAQTTLADTDMLVLATAGGATKKITGANLKTEVTTYRSGGTDVAVLDGGTGASTAAGARTNLSAAELYDPLGLGWATNCIEPMNGTSGTWDTGNRAYFWRLINGRAGATGIVVGITVSSGNLSFALYQNSGSGTSAVPGTLIVATGSVASPGTGLRTFALGASYDVPPGSWLGMTADNTSVAFSRFFNGIALETISPGQGGYKSTAHPLSGSSPSFDGAGFPGAAIVRVV